MATPERARAYWGSHQRGNSTAIFPRGRLPATQMGRGASNKFGIAISNIRFTAPATIGATLAFAQAVPGLVSPKAPISYALAGADALKFTINSSTGEIVHAASNAAGTYNITVNVSDGGSVTDSKAFVITGV